MAHGVAGEGPETGGLDPTENAERLWPSLRLAFDVLFSSNYWSVLVPVMVGALILAAFARAFAPVVFFGVLVAVTTLGGGWIVWAIPELPLTQELGETRSCATWARRHSCALPRARCSCPPRGRR